MIQAHLFFTGRVQGVGFRYTFKRIADQLKIKGWVKNLADGRVEALIETNDSKIEELCGLLQEEFSGNKIRIERYDSPSTGYFKDFHIAF